MQEPPPLLTSRGSETSLPGKDYTAKIVKLVKLKRKLKAKVQALKERKVKPYLIKPVYAEYSRVSKVVATLKRKQAIAAFQVMDTDADGEVSTDQFAQLVRRIAPDFSEEDVGKAVASLDENADGGISRKEFVAWWEDFDKSNAKILSLRRKLGDWEMLSAAAMRTPGPSADSLFIPSSSSGSTGALTKNYSSRVLGSVTSADEIETWPRIGPFQYRLNPKEPSLSTYFPFWEGMYAAPFMTATVTRLPLELLMRMLLSPQPYMYEAGGSSNSMGDGPSAADDNDNGNGEDGAASDDDVLSVDKELAMIWARTFSDYLSSSELMELLEERASCKPLPSVPKHCFSLGAIRASVLGFLHIWLDVGLEAFEERDLRDRATSLAESMLDTSTRVEGGAAPFAVERLARLATSLVRRLGQVDTVMGRRSGANGPLVWEYVEYIPVPDVPVSLRCSRLSLLRLGPLEFARQLTLVNFAAYRAIRPHEYLIKVDSPNVRAFAEQYSHIVNVVATQILITSPLPTQVELVCLIIDAALICYAFDNFFGMNALRVALGSAAIDRLSCIWSLLPPHYAKRMKRLEDINALKNRNKHLRDAHAKASPPGVPLTSLYDRNIITIDVAESKREGLYDAVNLERQRYMADEVDKLARFSRGAYLIHRLPLVEAFLLEDGPAWDEDQQYRASQALQPSGGNPSSSRRRGSVFVKPIPKFSLSSLLKPAVGVGGEPSTGRKGQSLVEQVDDTLYVVEGRVHFTSLPPDVFVGSVGHLLLPMIGRISVEDVLEAGLCLAQVPEDMDRQGHLNALMGGPESVQEVINLYQKIRALIASEIMTGETPMARSRRMCWAVDVARVGLVEGNAAVVIAVMSVLESSAIKSLKKTLALLPKDYEDTTQLMRHLWAERGKHHSYQALIKYSVSPIVASPNCHFRVLSSNILSVGLAAPHETLMELATSSWSMLRYQTAYALLSPRSQSVMNAIVSYNPKYGREPHHWALAAKHIGAAASSSSKERVVHPFWSGTTARTPDDVLADVFS